MAKEMNLEYCSQCGEPTGRAGVDEDSIYLAPGTQAEVGPLCESCYDTIVKDIPTMKFKVDVNCHNCSSRGWVEFRVKNFSWAERKKAENE